MMHSDHGGHYQISQDFRRKAWNHKIRFGTRNNTEYCCNKVASLQGQAYRCNFGCIHLPCQSYQQHPLHLEGPVWGMQCSKKGHCKMLQAADKDKRRISAGKLSERQRNKLLLHLDSISFFTECPKCLSKKPALPRHNGCLQMLQLQCGMEKIWVVMVDLSSISLMTNTFEGILLKIRCHCHTAIGVINWYIAWKNKVSWLLLKSSISIMAWEQNCQCSGNESQRK